MLPYILESLYNYRAVTEVWKQFLNKRTCPDVPEPKKLEKEISKKKKHDESGGEELPITDDDTHSEQQRYLHWQQSRPKLENQNRNIFSKLSFEWIARFINAHLERQSDRNIPKTSYRAGLTALTKMSRQEIPGLCLLTIFAMGGMMGPTFQKVESDFTILLWLSISLNDNLNMGVYTEECIDILDKKIRRYLAGTKALTGEQRELVSSVAYRIPKFHGMTHYPHLIKNFGTPINFFGGFLESFLNEKLKRPIHIVSNMIYY